MTFKVFTLGTTLLALAACGDNAQNPAALRGTNFIANGNGTNITLAFDANEMRFYGQVVNLYNGSYTAHGDSIKFDQGAMTMMMGPRDAMATEREYFEFLSTVEKYNLNAGTLTLTANNGRKMIFKQVAELPDDTTIVEDSEIITVDVPAATAE